METRNEGFDGKKTSAEAEAGAAPKTTWRYESAHFGMMMMMMWWTWSLRFFFVKTTETSWAYDGIFTILYKMHTNLKVDGYHL